MLGTYGTTSRRSVTVRRDPEDDPPILTSGPCRQVQRMGNPLINELIIGVGSKDRFSMDDPENDAQFANFFLHPILADVFASIGIPVPSGDRTDLLPLVTYTGPIVPPGTPAGADRRPAPHQHRHPADSARRRRSGWACSRCSTATPRTTTPPASPTAAGRATT